MKLRQKGAIDLTLIAVLATVFAIFGFAMWRIYNHDQEKKIVVQPVDGSCNLDREVRFCIAPKTSEVTNSDWIQIESSITNISKKAVNIALYRCISPKFYINDDPVTQFNLQCTLDASETGGVALKPSETMRFSTGLSASRLSPGMNTVYFEDSGYISGIVEIYKNSANFEDKEAE